jgi:hypothetical protein
MANRNLERKSQAQFSSGCFLPAHLAPYRRRFGFRIPGRQQQLRLMRAQRFRRFAACRPPSETPFRQPLGRQPEPLTVVSQDADRLPTPAAKDKFAYSSRIASSLLWRFTRNPVTMADSLAKRSCFALPGLGTAYRVIGEHAA